LEYRGLPLLSESRRFVAKQQIHTGRIPVPRADRPPPYSSHLPRGGVLVILLEAE
jgi:hypothetical protein